MTLVSSNVAGKAVAAILWTWAALVGSSAASPRQRKLISCQTVASGLSLSAGHWLTPPRTNVTLLPVSGAMMTGMGIEPKRLLPTSAWLLGQYLTALAAVYMPAGVKRTSATFDLNRS